MDPKAKKSIFLGYASCIKGYKFYDTEKWRVFYSRYVIFNKSRSIVELIENEKNDGDKKRFVVEIECQSNSENEDDNFEKLKSHKDRKEWGSLLIYTINGLTSLMD